MKVCGLTVINTPNYGSVLQAFALQEAVKKLGHSYTLLNYYNEAQEKKFKFFGKTKYMGWGYWIAKKVLYPVRRYQMKQILNFQNSNIHLSESIFDRYTIERTVNWYDTFIVGSDQVWNNQEINHFDSTFFLDFAEEKNTMAFAASFGKTYPMLKKEDIDFYKQNLKYVKHISVREDSGNEIVSRTSSKKSVTVCDPVFLLDRNDWEKYVKKPKDQNYIFVYLVGDGINFDVNKKIVGIAKRIGRKINKRIIVTGIGLSSLLYGSYKTPKVEEWLGLIKYADFIMTNAFHGTAFSMIFQKKFYCFVNGDQNNRMNTRIYDVLKRFGLESRIYSIDKDAAKTKSKKLKVSSQSLAYELDKYKEESEKWLDLAIQGDTAE